MAKKYLAFDLGASSGRGIVGSLDGGKLTLTEVHRFPNGPTEIDGALYWDFPALVKELETGLGEALKQFGALDGMAVDTWGVDYVVFDRATGKPKRWPYNYRDPRTEKAVTAVFKTISREDLYARTGMQFMSLNTIYQLVAHKLDHPEDFENSFMLFMPDALEYMFGGDCTNEYTEASTSNLLNPATRDWDYELLDLLGLPRDFFPRLVKPCTVGGKLAPEFCAKFNCAPIPVIKVGSHDTASAVAAVPAPAQGDWCYVSCGTWALLGAEIAEPICTPEAGVAPFTNEGGLNGKIRFLTNIMGSWLFQETRRIWRESGRDISYAQMEDLARAAEPGKFLLNPNAPHFLTPGDMPKRFREFTVATQQGELLDDGALLRAVYDSLALYFADKIHALEKLLGVKYQCVNMVGGGTKDGLLMQLTADAADLKVVAGPVEATATGNILAQGIALGEIADLAAAREVVKRSSKVIEYLPRPDMVAKFDAWRDRFDVLCK